MRKKYSNNTGTLSTGPSVLDKTTGQWGPLHLLGRPVVILSGISIFVYGGLQIFDWQTQGEIQYTTLWQTV